MASMVKDGDAPGTRSIHSNEGQRLGMISSELEHPAVEFPVGVRSIRLHDTEIHAAIEVTIRHHHTWLAVSAQTQGKQPITVRTVYVQPRRLAASDTEVGPLSPVRIIEGETNIPVVFNAKNSYKLASVVYKLDAAGLEDCG